jgi:hypothetical protein
LTVATSDPPTATTTDAPTYSLALEEGRRAFDLQVKQMDMVRTRATQVLAGAGIVASVYGGLVVRKDDPLLLVLGVVAVAAFIVLAVFCLLVLRSRPLTGPTSPRVLVEWVGTSGVTRGQMEQKLALFLGQAYDANLEKVNGM